MNKFLYVPKLGELNYDKIIFETQYPILFTASNNKKQLFLCVCCQHNCKGIKWLITKTTPEIMVKVLKNQIAIRDAFLVYKDIQITAYWSENQINFTENDQNDWDKDTSIFLPDSGEYLDAEDGEYDEEITYYQELAKEEKYLFSVPVTLVNDVVFRSNVEDALQKIKMQVWECLNNDYICVPVYKPRLGYNTIIKEPEVYIERPIISSPQNMHYETAKESLIKIAA